MDIATILISLFSIFSSMSIYQKKQKWKLYLFLFGLLISSGSLFYTQQLVDLLSAEERKKVELWASATSQLVNSSIADADLSFLLKVIQDNETVPVVLLDNDSTVVSYRNLDSTRVSDNNYLKRELDIMREQHETIIIDLGDGKKNFIVYKDSTILTKLTYFPYVQLAVVFLFIIISYLAFSASRKAEQNQVWVGLSKETAHQLGTPTSSLLAWIELLKDKFPDNEYIIEMQRDVQRLEHITARFSNIGSLPVLKPNDLNELVISNIDYLKSRTSSHVNYTYELPVNQLFVPTNYALFQWVVENICKNAIDAMDGKGNINFSIKEQMSRVIIDITDTGKGIPRSKFKTVFKPGYSTKSRGWGLGLSLAKRIVEEYHKGKIFVLSSVPDNGTTFRIVLKK